MVLVSTLCFVVKKKKTTTTFKIWFGEGDTDYMISSGDEKQGPKLTGSFFHTDLRGPRDKNSTFDCEDVGFPSHWIWTYDPETILPFCETGDTTKAWRKGWEVKRKQAPVRSLDPTPEYTWSWPSTCPHTSHESKAPFWLQPCYLLKQAIKRENRLQPGLSS